MDIILSGPVGNQNQGSKDITADTVLYLRSEWKEDLKKISGFKLHLGT